MRHRSLFVSLLLVGCAPTGTERPPPAGSPTLMRSESAMVPEPHATRPWQELARELIDRRLVDEQCGLEPSYAACTRCAANVSVTYPGEGSALDYCARLVLDTAASDETCASWIQSFCQGEIATLDARHVTTRSW